MVVSEDPCWGGSVDDGRPSARCEAGTCRAKMLLFQQKPTLHWDLPFWSRWMRRASRQLRYLLAGYFGAEGACWLGRFSHPGLPTCTGQQ
jgi:hypothetical protein